MQAKATRLQTQIRKVTGTLRSQRIDFETVKAMSDALGDASGGLENLATTLDAESIGKLGEGLLATASFLDEKVAPAAGMAADQLDASTGLLREDEGRPGQRLLPARQGIGHLVLFPRNPAVSYSTRNAFRKPPRLADSTAPAPAC